jgi:cell wall-associated NlpC family hydrolase
MFASRTRRISALSAMVIAALPVLPSAGTAAPIKTTPKIRATAALAAKKKVGAPYVSGAAGPRTFDCSGLVDFAYRVAGKRLGVRTSQQMARLGAGIRRTAVRPGDLVFTWTRGFGHVGIAIDRTHYIHAPAPGRRVTLAPIPAGTGLLAVRRP